MTRYARYISETEIQEPTDADFPGVPNWQTHHQKLVKNHFYPLVDCPDDREGYMTVLDRFSFTPKKSYHVEPRQVTIIDWETDPETGERRKSGEHQEMQDTEVEDDVSFITVLAYHYEEVPVPEPVLPRRFSKGDLLEALQGCNLYDQAKAIYASDIDLQIAWAGFSSIDMDFPATQSIMAKYPQLFTEENVLALQTYISEHAN